MRIDRVEAEIELRGDFLLCFSLHDALEDLGFPRCETVVPSRRRKAREHIEDSPRDASIHRRAPGERIANRPRNLLHWRSLQQITRSPGANGAKDFVFVLKDCED